MADVVGGADAVGWVLGATSDAAGWDVSGQLPGLLEVNRLLWKEFSSYLYADSASGAGKYLHEIAKSFDGWSVSYNKWTGPMGAKAADLPSWAWSAVVRHRFKGDWERRSSELLSDFQLHHPPCQRLVANQCFYALATLAYDVLQALKLLYLPESEVPKRVRTLIHHLLLIPVEIGRHARQIKASLYVPAGWVAWWRGFLAELLPKWRQLGVVAGSG